ncbi:hypothetical protein, partial [Rhizobium leguminosarum]|uniref:hypothetical protein n=1 Tax=Rhizobium leguminosarum TaxID=384 RepID=UPI003F9431E8
LLATALLFVFLSCHNNESAQLAKDEKAQNLELAESNKEEDYTYTSDTSVQAVPGNDKKKFQPTPNIDWEKKIIKTASLNIEVKDYAKFSST